MSLWKPVSKNLRAEVYWAAGEARLQEAEHLLVDFPSGAVYLAGYLVECHLKWALCRREGVDYLHDLSEPGLADRLTSGRGHDVETLCEVAGYDVHIGRNESVRRAFQVASWWNPGLRYRADFAQAREAVKFLAAVRVLRDDIRVWANV